MGNIVTEIIWWGDTAFSTLLSIILLVGFGKRRSRLHCHLLSVLALVVIVGVIGHITARSRMDLFFDEVFLIASTLTSLVHTVFTHVQVTLWMWSPQSKMVTPRSLYQGFSIVHCVSIFLSIFSHAYLLLVLFQSMSGDVATTRNAARIPFIMVMAVSFLFALLLLTLRLGLSGDTCRMFPAKYRQVSGLFVLALLQLGASITIYFEPLASLAFWWAWIVVVLSPDSLKGMVDEKPFLPVVADLDAQVLREEKLRK